MPATFQQLLGQIHPGGMAAFYSQGSGDGSTSGDTQNGGGTGGGGGFPDPNPIVIGTDPTTGGGGGGGYPAPGPIVIGTGPTPGPTTTPPTTTQTGLLPNPFSGFLNSIGCNVADALLRIAFFILGFIAIVGAIYLYKGSNTILQIPAKLTRATVKAGKRAVEAGALEA